MKILLMGLILAMFSLVAEADVYEFSDGSRKIVRILENDDSLLHLRTTEFAGTDLPVFIYNTFDYEVNRTFHPHKLTRKHLKESEMLLEKGNNYYNKEDYLNAIRYYEKTIALNPDYVFAYHNIGVCYLQLSRFQETIAAFERLLRKHDDYAYAYLYIAVANIHLQLYDKARQALDKAKAYPGILMDEECNSVIAALDERIDAVMFPY